MRVSARSDPKKPSKRPKRQRNKSATSPQYQFRWAKVRRQMAANAIPALLVTKLANIRYLTGFTGSSAMLLVTHKDAVFVTDGRYDSQSEEELSRAGFDGHILVYGAEGLAKTVKEAASIAEEKRVFLEAEAASWGFVIQLRKWLRGYKLEPSSQIIEQVRASKDPWEISRLKQAARLTDSAFSELLGWITPGVTEREVALRLVDYFESLGADGISFEPIVASGVRSALPHARPQDKQICNNELVVLDFGCRIDGYCSDMTRTVYLGKPDSEIRKLYTLVRRANEVGVAAVSANRLARTVDAAARGVIAKGGMGDLFVHSTGHGLGLEVHEWPRIGKGATDRIPLNCVVTVEPGVYLPGLGGFRIEDMVLAVRGGHSLLTRSPKGLIWM